MIQGLETPDSGTIKVGETVKISYVDQSRANIDPKKTLWEVVSDELDYINVGQVEMPSRAYVSAFGFKGPDQQKPAGVLSGGERNRLNLALTLKQGGNLLLLDEPTNDLDVETLSSLENALLEFPGCAVVVSHDRWFLDRVATHILAYEGDSKWFWFEGNFESYEKNKVERLGAGRRPSAPRHLQEAHPGLSDLAGTSTAARCAGRTWTPSGTSTTWSSSATWRRPGSTSCSGWRRGRQRRPSRGGSVVARHEIDYKRPLVHRHAPVDIETVGHARSGRRRFTIAYEVKDARPGLRRGPRRSSCRTTSRRSGRAGSPPEEREFLEEYRRRAGRRRRRGGGRRRMTVLHARRRGGGGGSRRLPRPAAALRPRRRGPAAGGRARRSPSSGGRRPSRCWRPARSAPPSRTSTARRTLDVDRVRRASCWSRRRRARRATVAVPAPVTGPPWAGVLPPRGGWRAGAGPAGRRGRARGCRGRGRRIPRPHRGAAAEEPHPGRAGPHRPTRSGPGTLGDDRPAAAGRARRPVAGLPAPGAYPRTGAAHRGSADGAAAGGRAVAAAAHAVRLGGRAAAYAGARGSAPCDQPAVFTIDAAAYVR